MKFRTRQDEEPDLNLVPLIDVMLMTLIFLVVTTSFSKDAQLHIRLPEASTEARTIPSGLRVTIDAKGQYFINERQLLKSTPDALRAAIGRAAGNEKDPFIIIHADARAPYESVVRVMDASRRLGYTRLTFATQQPSPHPAQP